MSRAMDQVSGGSLGAIGPGFPIGPGAVPGLRGLLRALVEAGSAQRATWRAVATHLGAYRRAVLHLSARAPDDLRRDRNRAESADDLFDSFRQLVVPQLDAAYNLARFLSRDPDAAQDIVQDAFVRAYRGFRGYRGGDVRAWLLAIVRNCSRDWQIERGRKLRFETDLGDGAETDEENAAPALARMSDEDTPETALIRKTEAEAVRAVLYGLPDPLREILVLRELEDLSYREIAEILAVPIGTVMSRLARARAALAEAWHDRTGDGEVGR